MQLKSKVVDELKRIGITNWEFSDDSDGDVVYVDVVTKTTSIYGLDPNNYDTEEERQIVINSVSSGALGIFIHIFSDLKHGGIIIDASYEKQVDEHGELFYHLTYTYGV